MGPPVHSHQKARAQDDMKAAFQKVNPLQLAGAEGKVEAVVMPVIGCRQVPEHVTQNGLVHQADFPPERLENVRMVRIKVEPDKASLFDLPGGLPEIDLGIHLLVEIESHRVTASLGRGFSLLLFNSHRRRV